MGGSGWKREGEEEKGLKSEISIVFRVLPVRGYVNIRGIRVKAWVKTGEKIK